MIRRGRLAPSPTGVLHLGNARSFLLAWLDARARGGRVLLRIEDLDGPRVKPGAAEAAIADLEWLGLDWDEGPVFQKPRLGRYAEVLADLAARGLAYPCTCSRRDVLRAASAPHPGEEGPIYPGTCRGRWRSAEEARAATGREPSWRFAVPAGRTVTIRDRVAGERRWRVAEELGDFVIARSNGEPAYQLAVVVDDRDQGVTDVVRGDDLLPSAARQTLLWEALGARPPAWAHLPLVVGPDGRRLAKRHGDTTLARFRADGVAPEELCGWLAAWSGLRPPGARCRPAELIEGFNTAAVPREPVVWAGVGPAR
ncbi:MAG: tRNA glutamyl-Q(34) synthetase GluQRS [Planctomycetota bacterium]|nr:MAG: tRNA glutamyl-Q(34) synthetase GluQRS [Planctomycetota bacterium]